MKTNSVFIEVVVPHTLQDLPINGDMELEIYSENYFVLLCHSLDTVQNQ